MKRSHKLFLIGFGVLGLALAAGLWWQLRPIRHEFFTDAVTIKQPTKRASVRDILWQPPRKLAEIINTGAEDFEPRLSWDGLTLFFVRGKAGDNSDIFFAERTPTGWTDPQPLEQVNSEYDDLGPEPTADGQRLYFYSNRPGSLGGYDIWVSQRGENGWRPAINLGPLVNSQYNDYGPAATREGKTLYFASNRPLPADVTTTDPDAWPATVREDLFRRTYDLYSAPILDSGLGKAEPLVALNTPYNEGAPSVSPVDDFLYFASNRPGGQGGFDLYRSRRLRGMHEEAKNLGATVNTSANELDPGLTQLGYALYFSSDRPKQRANPEQPNDYNLYYTSSREVFTEVETNRRPPLDLAALVPNLLWALLALLLLMLLWALWGSVRDKRLSVLVRCLLASLLAHLVILLLLSFWNVTTGVVDALRRRGEIRIALASPAQSDDIAVQIRGQLTEIQPPQFAQAALQRQETPIQPEPAPALLAALTVAPRPLEIEEQPEERAVAEDAPAENRAVEVPEPTVAQREPPPPIDVAVPAEAERIEAAEPEPSMAAAAPENAPIERPRNAITTTQPAVPPAQVTLLPRQGDTRDALAETGSLTENSAARDADSREQELRESTELTAALERRESTLDVSLPQQADRIAQAEPQRTTNTELAQPTEIARAEPTDSDPQPSERSEQITLAPERRPDDESPETAESLADRSTTRDAAARDQQLRETANATAARQQPESTLDVSLPEQTDRIAQAEPQRTTGSELAQPPEFARATPTNGQRQPIERTEQVALAPDGESRDPAESLAERSAARDAGPRVRLANLDSQTDVSLTTLPPANVALPTQHDAQPTQQEQTAPQLAAQPTQSPRFEKSDHLTREPTAQPLHTLQPQSRRERQADHPLTARADVRARDARPNHLTRNAPNAADAQPTAASLDKLALPPLELVAAPRENETTPQLAAASPNTTRAQRPTVPLRAPKRDFDALVALTPSARRETPSPYASLIKPNRDLDRSRPTNRVPGSRTSPFPTPPTAGLSLRLPVALDPPTDKFAHRTPAKRRELLERGGGSNETERAVALALRWLAEHQSDDGRWDADDFDDKCRQCGGESNFEVDRALTGLALLCFLGSGHTHVQDGPYRDTVENALHWLVSGQESDGDLRGDETMYSQGIATIAISEAYGMTGDSQLKDPIHRAIEFITQARNRRSGGWRYEPGEPGDTSVLGWQVMALKSARMAGIDVPQEAWQSAWNWLEIAADTRRPGLYSYRPRRPPTRSMTAEALFVRQMLGVGASDPSMQRAAAYVGQELPDWDARLNTYYWYYATLSLFQHQGELWERWNQRLTRQLLRHQVQRGQSAGSWAPDGEWASVGGRVYQTAICTLMLEVYYRYLPMYNLEHPEGSIGVIRGNVTDGVTGRPLPGAKVRLELPDRPPVIATTRDDGSYVLFPPAMPEHVALSASHEAYVPKSAGIRTVDVTDRALTLDFSLDPSNDRVVAIEAVPKLHHLGDNNFDGSINSQFQKRSEGTQYSAQFELSNKQVPPRITRAEVRLLAKGVQRNHKIFINGQLLDERLNEAPVDGSYGEFRAEFDPGLLRPGVNRFQIVAKPSSSDVDDFEFVNVRIWLFP